MICPGCGADTTGNYCAHCGQRQGPRVLSVGALLREVLEDQFSVNAALPRTLRALFFRPGLLTREYLRLRISPYVPPFRLYLVVSLLFFLVLALRARQPIELTEEDRAQIQREFAEARDSLVARRARGEPTIEGVFGITLDPGSEDWADDVEVNLGNERLNRAVKARLLQMRDRSASEALQTLAAEVVENIPKVMFLLLPLYALLLKLLHPRHYYVAHFIFSLHTHAFAFALFLLTLVLPWRQFAAGFAFLWLLIYQWLALKRVYEQGWLITSAKSVILFFAYTTAIAVAIVALLTVAVFSATV